MRFDELKATYDRVHQADQTCRREYALSDRAAVVLTFWASDREPVPTAVLAHWIDEPRAGALPDLARSYGSLGLDALTPQELIKLAEIRAMVDAWVAGQRDELPPSNSHRVAERDAELRSKM